MTDKNQQAVDEQEFWEWCGFIRKNYRSPACDHTTRCSYWEKGGRHVSDLPPIDLHNIEKYAFPKLAGYRISMTCSPGKPWKVDIYNASHEGSAKNKDLATALIETIRKVIHLEVK